MWKKSDNPVDKQDGKGEGEIKPPITLKSNEKIEGLGKGSEFVISDKKPTGWQRKILGLPIWGWVIISIILVWTGVTIGIVSHS
jgi:hypothetical protein